MEVSGGSAANTIVGVASFGGRAHYVGKVRDDQLGEVFRHDLAAVGVGYATAPATTGPSTGRCLIVVTPDAQRTLTTYLGASVHLGPADVDRALIERGRHPLSGGLPVRPAGGAACVPDGCRHGPRRRPQGGARRCRIRSASTVTAPPSGSWSSATSTSCSPTRSRSARCYEAADFDAALQQVRRHCAVAALTRSELGSVVAAGDEVHVIDAHPVAAGRRHHRGRRPLRGRVHGGTEPRPRPGHLRASRLAGRRRGHLARRGAPADAAGRAGAGAAVSATPALDAKYARLVALLRETRRRRRRLLGRRRLHAAGAGGRRRPRRAGGAGHGGLRDVSGGRAGRGAAARRAARAAPRDRADGGAGQSRSTRATAPTAASSARTSCSRGWRPSPSARASGTLVYGANMDDLGDHRPGMKAAAEHGVRAPLIEAALTQGGDPRPVARARAAHVGQALVRLPVLALPVRRPDHRRQAAPGGRRRDLRALARLPPVPRAPPRPAGPAGDPASRRSRACGRRAGTRRSWPASASWATSTSPSTWPASSPAAPTFCSASSGAPDG